MASVSGIPTTRVSELFVQQRLLKQIQSDQLELFRIQTQLSTGRRFELPSQDTDSAQQVMSFQRLLERKEQVRANLTTNNSYLRATDTALSSVSGMLAEIRGEALGVLGTIASETQRAAVVQQVGQTIAQLMDAGNQKFRGRYLFAGTDTDMQPFTAEPADLVKYCGNEARLASYSDIDVLFDTNLHGSEVFGAISEAVLGSADFNPVLTYDTRLADLRGGRGITPGSIAVTAGGNTSTIDLSRAETIGDVAAMIRAYPPEGKSLRVEITHTGLLIELEGAPGEKLTIREVGGGTTAGELGILAESGVSGPLVGDDLDPVLRLTTRAEDVLGTRAYTVVRSSGDDNDFILEADTPGAQLDDETELNGVTISFLDDPAVEAGSEVVDYDPDKKTIVVHIQQGATRASDVVTRINEERDLGKLPFRARLDPLDEQEGGNGVIDAGATGVTDKGDGIALDQASGLQIVNGGQTHVISFAGAETIEDMLNVLNMSEAGLLAQINEDATAIDVRSRVSGADLMIGENGGRTATDLGLCTFTRDTRLEDLNFGRGVDDQEGNGTVASATQTWQGTNNDLVFRARNTGSQWNNFTIRFVEKVPEGSETLTYDRLEKSMVFAINPGSTTANDLIDLFQNTPEAWTDFEIALDPSDGSPNDGTGVVWGDAAAFAVKQWPGDDNDLVFRAREVGEQCNDVTISFLLGPPGTQSLVYDRDAKTMDFRVDPATTKASDIITLVQLDPDANADFYVAVDSEDGSPPLTGSGPVSPGDPVVTSGGETSTPLTTAGGERVGSDFTITLADGTTIEIDLSDNNGTGYVAKTDPAAPPETAGGGAASYATASVASSGLHNDLIFQAKGVGSAYNETKINFHENPGVANATVASYSRGDQLTFEFDPGVHTARDIIKALQDDSVFLAGDDFSATLDPADGSGARTIGDVLALINVDTDILEARPATYGNGIELVDKTSGSGTLTVTRNSLSRAAIGLGLIPEGQQSSTPSSPGTVAEAAVTSAGANNDVVFTAVSPGNELNGVVVVFQDTGPGPDQVDYDPDARTLTFEITANATKANEIIALLAADTLAGDLFSASLTEQDDGIPNDGEGFVEDGAAATVSGGSQTLTGTDVNPLETDGIFTALLRLRTAIAENDAPEAERAIQLLDQAVLRLNFSRAELGARQQGLDMLQQRLDSEELDLQTALSEEFDADLAEVISEMSGRQIAFEAALQSAASILKMTLLDYL